MSRHGILQSRRSLRSYTALRTLVAKFELTTLESYDEDSLVEELQRVASLVPPGPISRSAFDAVSRVHSSTISRRLGDWRSALERAGLGDRYGGRRVSEKMRSQGAKALSDSELIEELRSAASDLNGDHLTMSRFDELSNRANSAGVKRRFGSWRAALELADLELSPLGRRYTDEDYFENILTVWTHYGRQPKYREMNAEPSAIPSDAYEAKFGGWRKALAAFVSRVSEESPPPPKRQQSPEATTSPSPKSRVRTIPIGLRYDVLRRDKFKCVLCGASPATNPACQLHVDHIVPFSRGGESKLANLRTLCAQCNIGKSNKVGEGAV